MPCATPRERRPPHKGISKKVHARGEVQGEVKGEVLSRRGTCAELTRFTCPQGTARIQLRCRTVSATVLIGMLVVRSGFVAYSTLGPEFVSKMQAPNLPQDPQNGTKNAAGIPKRDPKTTNMAPKIGTGTPRWGPNAPDGRGDRFWCEKGSSRHGFLILFGYQNGKKNQ